MFPQHICLHIKPLTYYVTQRLADANTQIIILHVLAVEGPQIGQTFFKSLMHQRFYHSCLVAYQQQEANQMVVNFETSERNPLWNPDFSSHEMGLCCGHLRAEEHLKAVVK